MHPHISSDYIITVIPHFSYIMDADVPNKQH